MADSLTPFSSEEQRLLQVNAVCGWVPVWSMVKFREYAISNQQIISQKTFGFQRRAFSLHVTLNVNASYAFGRRRSTSACVTDLATGSLTY